MGLHVERVGDVAVVMPEGMLKGGKETDELQNALRKLIYDRQKKIILDLAKTEVSEKVAELATMGRAVGMGYARSQRVLTHDIVLSARYEIDLAGELYSVTPRLQPDSSTRS